MKDLYLKQLRIAVPFLQEIPDLIYFSLDTSELYLPIGNVQLVRTTLEKSLGQYVMTYKRDVFNLSVPVQHHLCANIKGADLTNKVLNLLQNAEEILKSEGISLVVYHRPLTLITPQNSIVAGFYAQKGLPAV